MFLSTDFIRLSVPCFHQLGFFVFDSFSLQRSRFQLSARNICIMKEVQYCAKQKNEKCSQQLSYHLWSHFPLDQGPIPPTDLDTEVSLLQDNKRM